MTKMWAISPSKGPMCRSRDPTCYSTCKHEHLAPDNMVKDTWHLTRNIWQASVICRAALQSSVTFEHTPDRHTQTYKPDTLHPSPKSPQQGSSQAGCVHAIKTATRLLTIQLYLFLMHQVIHRSSEPEATLRLRGSCCVLCYITAKSHTVGC